EHPGLIRSGWWGVRPSRRLRIAALVLGAFMLLVVTGSAKERRTAPVGQLTNAPVWPAPPDPPRIAFVQSIGRPADAGVKLQALSRCGHWLTGSEKGNEPLVKPFGIAFDEKDNLCLTDTGANSVCYFDRAKKKWQRWDKLGHLGFVAPVAVAKRGGIFYVADSCLASVLAFDERGKLLLQISNHLERPSGLALLKER